MASYMDIDRIDAKHALYLKAKQLRADIAYGFVCKEFPELLQEDQPKRWPTIIIIECLLFIAILAMMLLFQTHIYIAAVLAILVLSLSNFQGLSAAIKGTLIRRPRPTESPTRESGFRLAYAWVDTQNRLWRYGALVRAWECEDGLRRGSWPSH